MTKQTAYETLQEMHGPDATILETWDAHRSGGYGFIVVKLRGDRVLLYHKDSSFGLLHTKLSTTNLWFNSGQEMTLTELREFARDKHQHHLEALLNDHF